MIAVGPALHQVRRAVAQELAGVDTPVLVACSGGPDSLALAAAVAALDRSAGAVVVDHGLQSDSDVVARRAGEQCRALGLDPVTVARVQVTPDGTGPEAAARTARYAALGRIAAGSGATVLLAHTRDDQAETVLLGLVRGSGPRSLAGMPRRRGVFRRPLLDLSRAEVAAALAETGLASWTDPHNSDPAYRRVRVRALLADLDRELGPGIPAALARTADLARADSDALDEWARRAGREWVAADRPVDVLATLPRAVRTRVLRDAARAAGTPAGSLTATHVAELDRLVTDWRGQGPLPLPGHVIAGREYGRLYLRVLPDDDPTRPHRSEQ